MTEDEAKTKWCPFARLIPAKRIEGTAIQHDQGAPTFNRYNIDEPNMSVLPTGGMCVGVACMAWRWGPTVFAKRAARGASVDESEPPPARPPEVAATWGWEPDDGEGESCWREPQAEADKRRQGFCGLAGSP